ncbi:MAG: aminopeptidase P family protein [Oscillospiraceae bacterium]|nr:aminopeptidase P family protein [Oscillospiraceae bacterium]
MRINALKSKLIRENIAALITSGVNTRYFTGYQGAGALFLSPGRQVFLTDARFSGEAEKIITNCDVAQYKDFYEALNGLVGDEKIKDLHIEAEKTAVARLDKYKDKLPAVNFLTGGDLDKEISAMRAVKSAEEIKFMREAQEIAETAFFHILDYIETGMTEKEIAIELEYFMFKNGAEKISFGTIAVSGVNSAFPHGTPTDKKIEKGDFLTLDFGAVVNGYHSDMTRTVAVGEPGGEKKEIYSLVLKAQEAALEGLKEGLSCKEADARARNIIAEAGYGENFGHGTGHGVGLEVHESPTVSSKSEETEILEEGNVITVEPGIYLPGKFGVRIEDMAVIKDDGYLNLTEADKSLIVL